MTTFVASVALLRTTTTVLVSQHQLQLPRYVADRTTTTVRRSTSETVCHTWIWNIGLLEIDWPEAYKPELLRRGHLHTPGTMKPLALLPLLVPLVYAEHSRHALDDDQHPINPSTRGRLRLSTFLHVGCRGFLVHRPHDGLFLWGESLNKIDLGTERGLGREVAGTSVFDVEIGEVRRICQSFGRTFVSIAVTKCG